ncbi:succinate dehydrogenase assembly factor 2 [Spiribacter sp. C176]|uniref:FAD assembly factor SdhE n=1 Tax=Spiribacter salilacus TaxID=2664894 RepID=A0A6N7QPW9_9GAMM|nr:succinate dehydrogenase assembly factor 2 [Spiribacter salilacus]
MSELSRLRWRCRRGTTELDRLLGRFLDADSNGYQALDTEGRAAFEQLLACEDDDLIDWLLSGHLPTEPQLVDIVTRVRAASGL